MPIRRFIFKDEKSHKFWNVSWEEEYGDEYTVHYGRVGSEGVTKEIECEDTEEDIAKLIKSKVKKGYEQVFLDPIEADYQYSVEDTVKNLNAQFKIGYCVRNYKGYKYFEFEKCGSTKNYHFQNGGGDDYEFVVKGNRALVRAQNHECSFNIDTASTLASLTDYALRGVSEDLVCSVDTEYMSYAMWTNEEGVWLQNVMEEDYFYEDFDIDLDDYELPFALFYTRDDYKRWDNYSDELLDIAFKDEPITKEEVIKIMELTGNNSPENLARVDSIVEDLEDMYL